MTRRYRAVIERDNGEDEDWGFFDLNIHESGALLIRSDEITEFGKFDAILAHGTWRELKDVIVEGES